MRRLAFLLLLASAAAPVLAADEDARGNRHGRSQGTEQSENRDQRAPQSRRSQDGESRMSGPRRSEGGGANEADRAEHIRERSQQRQVSAPVQSDDSSPVRSWRRGERPDAVDSPGSALRPRERQVRTIPDTQPNVAGERQGEVARSFHGPARRDYRDGNYRRWSTHWHRDSRYDWRRYRDRYGSRFRLGFYYDPFGWSYRRWSFGSYLYPGYYGSRYWLNDPWHYRLPPAYGPYRWVRYWNDAVLVNIYTGQVVEVIYGFFW
jgi:hypothetical protein